MIDWEYNGVKIKELDDFDEDVIGFIYITEFDNGKKYIGRKSLYHTRTYPPLKGKKRKRKKTVESDWKRYIGSPKDPKLRKKIKKGEVNVTGRKILRQCVTLWEMTYYETKYQFETDCILDDSYYNGNILGRFYRPKK